MDRGKRNSKFVRAFSNCFNPHRPLVNLEKYALNLFSRIKRQETFIRNFQPTDDNIHIRDFRSYREFTMLPMYGGHNNPNQAFNQWFNNPLPAWRMPGVQFSWVKFHNTGKNTPAFIFPEMQNGNYMAQYITLKGVLSDYKHPIYSTSTGDTPKLDSRIKALNKFNYANGTDFE